MNGKARSKRYHLSIVGLAIVVLCAGSIYRDQIRKKASDASARMESTNASLMTEVQQLKMAFYGAETDSIQNVVANIKEQTFPSLVCILEPKTKTFSPPFPELYSDDLQKFPEEVDPDDLSSGSKSGIVIDDAGHILTSFARAEQELRVRFHDGRQAVADLIAVDSKEQLSLLKLREHDNIRSFGKVIPVDNPKIGDWLLRVGRSSSGQQSISTGVFSSIRKAKFRSLFVLDGQMTPEQHGGLVLNLKGEIAGISVPLSQESGASILVPIERALNIAENLKSKTKIPTSWIGVSIQELNQDMKKYFSVENGALVAEVIENSPSQQAGLRAADIILEINGAPVSSAGLLLAQIQAMPAGTTLSLRVRRAGKAKVLEMQTNSHAERLENKDVFGIEIDGSPTKGVEIKNILPKGRGDRMGLRTGDLILEVNATPVSNHLDFLKAQRKARANQVQLWKLKRSGNDFYVIMSSQDFSG